MAAPATPTEDRAGAPAPVPPRRAGWLDGTLADLTCPAGHRIAEGQLTILAHVFQCNHREHRGAKACGKLVFAHIFTGAVGEPSLIYLVEVKWAEVPQIRRLQRESPQALMRYLGVPLWPGRTRPRRVEDRVEATESPDPHGGAPR